MDTTTITFDPPMKRGDNEIKQVVLHKPKSGALRGVSLRDCIDMNTDAICAVIPRISDPKITPQEMETMEPFNLLALGAALSNFLLPPAVRAAAEIQFNSLTE